MGSKERDTDLGGKLQFTGVLFSEATLAPVLLPFFNMSSAICEDNRASPSITGQMGWSAPEIVKPAASILLRNLGTQLSVTGKLKAMEPEEEAQDLCPPVRGRTKDRSTDPKSRWGSGRGRKDKGRWESRRSQRGQWRLKENAVAEGVGRTRGRWAGRGREVCGYHLSLIHPCRHCTAGSWQP